MSDNNSDFGAFLAGLMIGGLVGAAVALLMAPQSGEETRVLIRDKSIEIKDEARVRADDAIVDLRSRTDELARVTKERAEVYTKKGGETVVEEEAVVVVEEQIDEESPPE